jgi:NAD(P)H-nitrite reductase large subunit
VMDLMRRSKPLSRRLDLRGAAYPHVHRQTKNCVGSELVKVGVEVPQNIDDGGVKGKPRISPFL